MKVKSKLQLAPDEKKLGKIDTKKQTKSKNYSVNVKPKPKTSYHKDFKSHNVNIKVISGINGNLISDIKDKLDVLNKWNKVLEKLNIEFKSPTVPKWQKTLIRMDITRVKNIIKDLKTDISKTQKKVK
jgi:hypothetical protein